MTTLVSSFPTLAALIAVAGLTVFGGLAFLVMYNRFVRQRALIEESWGQTDVELTRRHTLIPNLVATVQGYAAHEAQVLEAVTKARADAETHQADSPADREPYEQRLGGAVHDVLVRAEAYPDLKASTNFLQLQEELTNTEDRIAAARRFYNGNVRAYNTRASTFPSNLVAAIFGFTRRPFFELADPGARSAPTVELG